MNRKESPVSRTAIGFASCFGAACVVALASACGGGAKPAESATGPAAASDPASASGPSAAAADPSKGSGPATTTTAPSTVLPDGGELQGAKLQSTTKTTTLETKGEGGPKPPAGGSQEPGRKREDIQTIVMARRDEARKCYDDGLKAHPGIEGDLVVKWTIDPKGVATNVMVDESKSQILEPSVGKCVVAIIQKIKFNESAKGFETHANYPFNFRPRGPQPGSTPPKK